MGVAIAIAAALLLDLQRSPDRQWSTAATLGGIGFYQRHLSSGWAILGVKCRFIPSCSHYAESVVRDYGVVRGGWLSLGRIARCGPWTPIGTIDPPPKMAQGS